MRDVRRRIEDEFRLSPSSLCPPPSSFPKECGMRFLRDKAGDVSVEYIVVMAIAIAVVGPILYAIFQALQARYVDVYKGL
jgi:Flp pilus assembly pilin Flp